MEQGLYHLAALLFLLGCVSAGGALLCFWVGRWRFFRGCVVLGAATVAAATVCLLAGLVSVRGGDRLQLVESAGKWYVELEPHLLSQAGLSPQVEQAREEIRASYEADAGPDVTPGVWQRKFGSWAEAEEFLGLPLTESAALSEEPESPDVARPEDERCTVYLHGRPDGPAAQCHRGIPLHPGGGRAGGLCPCLFLRRVPPGPPAGPGEGGDGLVL